MNNPTTQSIIQMDALEFLRAQEPSSLDLVFGSPPYEQCRLYLEGGVNMGISRKTDVWVAWMVEVYKSAQVACKGLVAFVVAGQTKGYRWSAGPALLMAELHRSGMNLRNPPIFSRVGIPGSGGPDWLRSDYEWIVCTSRPGQLPWSDNTACGAPPKWRAGGEMSYRTLDGERVNYRPQMNLTSSGTKNGDLTYRKKRSPIPDIANPGNIIHLNVGGGSMGHELAHENEAPFPEKLAEFFVKSFCPIDGWVCDPYSGSGTTSVATKRHGRNFVGCDLRQSQVAIGLKRLALETPPLFS